jgi:ElaB/YqjD/DUF883 family membrane-anchored ribosome-binding protein
VADSHRSEHQGKGRSSQGSEKKSQEQSLSENVQQTASSVTEKAQELWENRGETAAQIQERAGQALSSVGEQMKHLAGTLRERAPQEGMVGSAASVVANTLESGGSYLQEQDLSEMVEDVSTVIRRYPIPSVLVGVGIGFLLAKTFRS